MNFPLFICITISSRGLRKGILDFLRKEREKERNVLSKGSVYLMNIPDFCARSQMADFLKAELKDDYSRESLVLSVPS